MTTGKTVSSTVFVILTIVLCVGSYLLGVKNGKAGALLETSGRSALSGDVAEEASDSLQGGIVEDKASSSSVSPEPSPKVANVGDSESDQKQRLMRNLESNLAMPGMNRIIQEQQRVLMADKYRQLIERLSLSDREKEYFIDLLTARQMLQVDMGMKLMTGMLSDEERTAMMMKVHDESEALGKEIDWFLNSEADSEYLEYYEKTEGERSLVNSVSSQLDQAGAPLVEGVDEALVSILHKEISSYPFSVEFETDGEADFSKFTTDNIDTFVNEMENLRDPVIKEAERLLTPGQLDVFSGSFDEYIAFYAQRLQIVQQLFNTGP